MLKNKNMAFVCLMLALAASEFGLVNSLAALVHRCGEIWENLLYATGYGGLATAIINRLLNVLNR